MVGKFGEEFQLADRWMGQCTAKLNSAAFCTQTTSNTIESPTLIEREVQATNVDANQVQEQKSHKRIYMYGPQKVY